MQIMIKSSPKTQIKVDEEVEKPADAPGVMSARKRIDSGPVDALQHALTHNLLPDEKFRKYSEPAAPKFISKDLLKKGKEIASDLQPEDNFSERSGRSRVTEIRFEFLDVDDQPILNHFSRAKSSVIPRSNAI